MLGVRGLLCLLLVMSTGSGLNAEGWTSRGFAEAVERYRIELEANNWDVLQLEPALRRAVIQDLEERSSEHIAALVEGRPSIRPISGDAAMVVSANVLLHLASLARDAAWHEAANCYRRLAIHLLEMRRFDRPAIADCRADVYHETNRQRDLAMIDALRESEPLMIRWSLHVQLFELYTLGLLSDGLKKD